MKFDVKIRCKHTYKLYRQLSIIWGCISGDFPAPHKLQCPVKNLSMLVNSLVYRYSMTAAPIQGGWSFILW
jgi:hypothetical protein